jgi:hypothetical protein
VRQGALTADCADFTDQRHDQNQRMISRLNSPSDMSVDGSLPVEGKSSMVAGMRAVAEIESAIERLSPAEVKELAAWLEEYQQMINASAEIFQIYEQEEGGR